jgi:hydroxyacylglutathione hydrolase
MLIVQLKVVGFFRTNCWMIEAPEDGICAIVDPGFNGRKILQWTELMGLQVKFILLTHGHLDHIMAAHYLQRKTKAPCLLHHKDIKYRWRWGGVSLAKFTPIENGHVLKLANTELKVIHTPGHTPGSVSYLAENNLFSGDLLFADGVGRWDTPKGSFHELVKSLRERIAELPDATQVLPGHGPETTLGIERERNPIFWERDKK